MSGLRNPGRIAGLYYLIIAVFAPLRLMIIPNLLIVHGDAAATAQRISSHELLFRFGMVSDLVCGVALIFVVLAFYRLFKPVDPHLAMLLVIVGGVLPAAIDFINVLNDAAALALVKGGPHLDALDEPRRDALAMLFLHLQHQVVVGAEVLWGLWLFPLAALGWRARLLPRALAIWLVVNGVAYLVLSLIGLLAPALEQTVSNYAFPALMGELATVLWLLVKGSPVPEAARA